MAASRNEIWSGGSSSRRSVAASTPERMGGMLLIAGEQGQPCLDEILFDYDTVGPSPVGRPGVRSEVDELAIDDRPRQYPAHMTSRGHVILPPSAGLDVPVRQSERGHSQLSPHRPRVA